MGLLDWSTDRYPRQPIFACSFLAKRIEVAKLYHFDTTSQSVASPVDPLSLKQPSSEFLSAN